MLGSKDTDFFTNTVILLMSLHMKSLLTLYLLALINTTTNKFFFFFFLFLNGRNITYIILYIVIVVFA